MDCVCGSANFFGGIGENVGWDFGIIGFGQSVIKMEIFGKDLSLSIIEVDAINCIMYRNYLTRDSIGCKFLMFYNF